MKKYRPIIIKSLVSFLIISLVTFGLHMIMYRTLDLEDISNSMFLVNILVFAIALIIQVGALRSTLGLRYTAKMLFQQQKTKETYDSYQDYYDEHAPNQQRNVIYLLIISGLFIAASFILAMLSLN